MKTINTSFFENPVDDPDYSVSGFWFWNDLIKEDELRKQLDMMKQISANQPVIHARNGLLTEYLSEDWFLLFKFTVEECKKNRQKCWIYDEKDWPSGNCGWSLTKDEKNREHFLQFDFFDLKANKLIHLSKNYLTASAFFADGKCKTLDLNIKSFTFTEDAEIICVYIDVDPYEKSGKYNIDYLSDDAIKNFIESTHEKYKERFAGDFGKTILGTFMDETRFCNAMPWTEKFSDEFKKRKGYDIVSFLPYLVRGGDKSDLIRFDYYDVVSDLYAENTYKQIYDWCGKNNLKTTGHVLGEETIATQSYFGADVMRIFRYLHVPGIDHLGNGIGSLDAKFTASAAHHYGKDRVSCEAFGASGWDMEYESMVRISNWLFQQGINLIIMHGFYYSIRDERKDDFPPSYFFQWKHWDKMKDYVPMANRMMEMLSGGYPETGILVYSPMETFWTYFEPDLSLKTFFAKPGTPLAKYGSAPPPIKNERAKFIDNEFQLICSSLADENLDYEIIGSDAFSNFRTENGCLINIHTGASYSVIVLPCVKIMTPDMTDLLDKFSKESGIVISYQNENYITAAKDGSHMRKVLKTANALKYNVVTEISEIISLCEKNVKLPFKIISGTDKTKHSQPSYPDYLIDPYIHDDERVYGVGISRYIKKGARIFNFTNYNENPESLRVWVESEDTPQLFVPETGEIKILTQAEMSDNGYKFDLAIPANRAVFVVCKTL